MNTDALRGELSTLDRLLENLPDTVMVGSPHVGEYDRAIDRLVELGVDADAFRMYPNPEADAKACESEPEVERTRFLMQIASLASRVKLLLKRQALGKRPPIDPRSQ